MNSPYLEWMDQEACETLENCFDWKSEKILPGASVKTDGRVGWILQGEGLFRPAGSAEDQSCSPRYVSSGTFIGVKRDAKGDKVIDDGSFAASVPCEIAWFQYDLLRFSCYRGCWFHARVMREVDAALN